MVISNTTISGYAISIERLGGTISEDYSLFYGVSAPISGVVSSGTHHPSGDPMFSNPAADDYHIGGLSAALDARLNLGLASDMDLDTRPQGPEVDMGYDESTLLWRVYSPFMRR